MDCDSSCISGTVGPAGLAQGDSCTGPDAGDCTKCPYLCDPTCDKESSPSYAEWGLGDSSGKFKCLPCDPSCTSCTGPDADQCTTCNEECDVSQCKHGQYPHGSECNDCDPSCEFCTGPGANECATCPKSCEISDCKNGEYLMGTKCEKCDASCTASGQGYGESCVGPEAGDCVKCPYECDVTCEDPYSGPMYADWSLGNLDCQPCASECGKSAEIDGASCTGPSKDECTTCFPPKACALSQCANGEYAIGTKCEKCDASCTASGQGYGESCTGPGARDCVKCPYECDVSCAAFPVPAYADWSLVTRGALNCEPCAPECVGNGDADKTGAGCTGPSKDECTTCISPPPPSPPADPPPLPPADPPPSPQIRFITPIAKWASGLTKTARTRVSRATRAAPAAVEAPPAPPTARAADRPPPPAIRAALRSARSRASTAASSPHAPAARSPLPPSWPPWPPTASSPPPQTRRPRRPPCRCRALRSSTTPTCAPSRATSSSCTASASSTTPPSPTSSARRSTCAPSHRARPT